MLAQPDEAKMLSTNTTAAVKLLGLFDMDGKARPSTEKSQADARWWDRSGRPSPSAGPQRWGGILVEKSPGTFFFEMDDPFVHDSLAERDCV